MADDIVVVGEALLDIVVAQGGARSEHPGGSPANVAHGLALLGLPVRLLTQLGNDRHGAEIERQLADAGVDVVSVGTDPAAGTATATATLDANAAATYAFDLTWDVSLPRDADAPRAVHTGSLASTVQPGAGAVLDYVRAQRGRAFVSYDPNVRPAFVTSREAARRDVEEFVREADVVKVSDEDLAVLFPGDAPAVVAARWLELGPSLVVVTLGPDGAYATNGTTTIDVPALATHVVDTVGAGDAFMVGLLAGLDARGWLAAGARAAVRAAGTAELAEVLHHASVTAAATVTRAGASFPHRAEVLAALEG